MRYRMVWFVPVGLLLLVASLVYLPIGEAERFDRPGLADPVESFAGDQTYRVLKVVDGDTIKIDYKGKTESVRLIGVDTPETVHPNKPVEFFGKEASAFTKNLLRGEHVYLRFGNEERGKYNRLLAYVFRAPDGLFVNLEIVRQGYGHAYVKYPFEHMELFRHYEMRARGFGKGLWSESSTATTTDVGPKSKSESAVAADDDTTVYVTKSGSKYHLDSCRWGNIAMSLSEARERYSPCAKCDPPQ